MSTVTWEDATKSFQTQLCRLKHRTPQLWTPSWCFHTWSFPTRKPSCFGTSRVSGSWPDASTSSAWYIWHHHKHCTWWILLITCIFDFLGRIRYFLKWNNTIWDYIDFRRIYPLLVISSLHFLLNFNIQISHNICIFKHNVFLSIRVKKNMYIRTKTKHNVADNIMHR